MVVFRNCVHFSKGERWRSRPSGAQRSCLGFVVVVTVAVVVVVQGVVVVVTVGVVVVTVAVVVVEASEEVYTISSSRIIMGNCSQPPILGYRVTYQANRFLAELARIDVLPW